MRMSEKNDVFRQKKINKYDPKYIIYFMPTFNL